METANWITSAFASLLLQEGNVLKRVVTASSSCRVHMVVDAGEPLSISGGSMGREASEEVFQGEVEGLLER